MIIAYVVIAAVALFFVVVALQPSSFSVSRSTRIAAPSEIVFEQVNDLHKWQVWSPWAEIDPNAKIVYDGPVAGVGAAFAWSGNMQVGEGRMAIVESRANEVVRFKIDFAKPMKGTNIAGFTFKSDGDQTVVNWTMHGKKNFMARAIGLVMSCEKMIGGNFEKGLASMKSLAEAAAKTRPASRNLAYSESR